MFSTWSVCDVFYINCPAGASILCRRAATWSLNAADGVTMETATTERRGFCWF